MADTPVREQLHCQRIHNLRKQTGFRRSLKASFQPLGKGSDSSAGSNMADISMPQPWNKSLSISRYYGTVKSTSRLIGIHLNVTGCRLLAANLLHATGIPYKSRNAQISVNTHTGETACIGPRLLALCSTSPKAFRGCLCPNQRIQYPPPHNSPQSRSS